MDIALAQTYLAIIDCGSFQGAADRLNVTQSTVSARVQTLEAQLGQPLFQRGRHGAQTTDAGRRFRRYAENMVRTWLQARQDIALPDNLSGSIAVSGQISLWDQLLPHWLRWMRENAADVALRVDFDTTEQIVRQLTEGALSFAVMYTPVHRSGLTIDPLFEDHLILVQAGDAPAGPGTPDYVYVDWGPEYMAAYTQSWPNETMPAIFVRIGLLGLQHIMANGGSGYFPERTVRTHLADGRLRLVDGAPTFRRPAWLVRNEERDDPTIARACEGIRVAAARLIA